MNTNHHNGYHDPVRAHTVEHINDWVDARIEENIASLRHAPPQEINHRLNQLEEEWDVERMTMANVGGLAAIGGLLGMVLGRKWFWLSALAGGFMIQQATQGWCPPVSFARRFRMRTREEINREYEALCSVLADRGEAMTSEPEPFTAPGSQPGMSVPPIHSH